MRGLFHPDVPFAPRRVRFFYGWVIVAVGTLALFASIPGQTMGVSVFNDALIEATGLSRLGVANAYLTGTILSGLSLPKGGLLLDRWGARRTMLATSWGLGTVLVALSFVGEYPLVEGPVLNFALLAALFFGLRFMGQGMLAMNARTTMARWFRKRRGLVAGISGVFVGYAFGLAPQALDGWIAHSGWRGAWREMSLVIALAFGALAWLLMRNDPESSGLRMDGAHEDDPAADDEPSKTRAQALRTLAFWAVTLTLASQALIITGVTFHIVDIGAKIGLDRSASVAVFFPMAVVSTATGLAGGVLADRLKVRTLVLVMLTAQAVGLFGAAMLDRSILPFVAGFGVSGGLFGPVAQVSYPRFFGRLHLGSIAGAQMMAVVLGSAVGPSLFALSESFGGSYAPALYGLLALPVLCVVLSARIGDGPSPRRSAGTSTES